MEASDFDEEEFFRNIEKSGVRALLIGRQALIVYGIPVLTDDYDLWLHGEDIERLNAAVEPLALYPNHPPEEARRRGRYVLENDTRVDVLITRRMTGKDGVVTTFAEAWDRRKALRYAQAQAVKITLPSIDDLIRTKRWSMRPRDLEDIHQLEARRAEAGEEP